MSTLSNDLFVEMREISKDKRYENKTLYQMYHGQLQLSVVRDGRFVCVNVQSARHMKPTTTKLYVKIKLTHSNNQRIIHRTPTVHGDDPTWNYTCNLKLKTTIYSRLLISVWSENSKCHGCMTFHFTPQSARTNIADGWYFLLHKSLGIKKHLKVTLHRPGFRTQSTAPDTTVRASYSTYHTVRLQSSTREYGMKLSGQHPVRVSKVLRGSVAAEAGVLSEDYIVKINDLDVSSLTLSSLIQIIQQSDCTLDVAIARHPILDVVSLDRSLVKRSVNRTYDVMDEDAKSGSVVGTTESETSVDTFASSVATSVSSFDTSGSSDDMVDSYGAKSGYYIRKIDFDDSCITYSDLVMYNYRPH